VTASAFRGAGQSAQVDTGASIRMPSAPSGTTGINASPLSSAAIRDIIYGLAETRYADPAVAFRAGKPSA